MSREPNPFKIFIIAIGPIACGKSTALHIMKEALKDRFEVSGTGHPELRTEYLTLTLNLRDTDAQSS